MAQRIVALIGAIGIGAVLIAIAIKLAVTLIR